MKTEDFRFLIDCKKEFEFDFRGIKYSITYGSDSKGDYIAFGRLFQPKRFYSWGDLMNEAEVENSYFREVLEDL